MCVYVLCLQRTASLSTECDSLQLGAILALLLPSPTTPPSAPCAHTCTGTALSHGQWHTVRRVSKKQNRNASPPGEFFWLPLPGKQNDDNNNNNKNRCTTTGKKKTTCNGVSKLLPSNRLCHGPSANQQLFINSADIREVIWFLIVNANVTAQSQKPEMSLMFGKAHFATCRAA